MVSMNLRLRDRDEAERFLASCDIDALVAKYPECSDSELASDTTKFAMYLKLREEGAEHVWALMSACRRPPGTSNSAKTFEAGNRARMAGMGDEHLDRKLAAASKAGISTHGKFHMSSLGPASDPGAWVSGPDDVLAVCRARNLNCEGAVTHKARPVEPKPKVRLSERLTKEMEARYLQNDPSLAAKVKKNPKERQALREKIVAKHGAPA